ncbi:peptidase S8 [Bacillus sp. V3-13]|uniref:S8 family serine peptidase n=1 Tax=Bacillus sp. V3-13 TaxID=2053728 RepID=UPI000C76EADA|nr:S8 family serine peptidase [Bacillus sp. V3-13]PLR76831.1 peptidase S8 [Bacillus sp. V3-13]
MVRKMASIITFIWLIAAAAASQSKILEHPPIPKDDPGQTNIAIVVLKDTQSKRDIEGLLAKFPDLELRHIFKHTLNGFSVKGDVHSFEKLAKQQAVSLVSPVQAYTVNTEENIKMIGGEAVRGLFDAKNERLTGKGITVGVIDTGLDYTHPDLRRNYRGGSDFIDGDHDPMESQGGPRQRTLHGTHVAGVIAANGRFKGVAPEAEIVAYRALGPGGGGTTEQIIAAIEQAIKDRVDILNLSLGNNVNGPDLPISLALNKAVENGITAVTSSGNSGPGIWTVGSPGTASKAISVGASTPPMKIPYLLLEGSAKKIRMEPMQGADVWKLDRSLQMVFAGLGEEKDLKNAAGKIVLLERGKLTFTEKARNAKKAGAAAVIIYNNTDGHFIGNLEENVSIPVVSVSKKTGIQLKKHLEKKEIYSRAILIEEKDLLAEFSSRGPVTDSWEIKPDIVAPGVAINSTVPGGYLSLQGTSMAAPHVAGVCALIKQAHPNWTPEQIKASLLNTAKKLYNEKGEAYRTYEQGAGRIQAVEAINNETLVMPGTIQFGKFQLAEHLHRHKASLTIENTGTDVKKYSFSVPKKTPGIHWEIPLSFDLLPHQKKRVELAMRVEPSQLKEKIQDGELILRQGSKQIRIPYLYVLEEPAYPRIMGFDFVIGDDSQSYRYEVYLPGGAEEFGIAIFDPDHYRFLGFLDWERNVKKGLIQKEVKAEQLPADGLYLLKIFAKKAGREDVIEAYIQIGKKESRNLSRND